MSGDDTPEKQKQKVGIIVMDMKSNRKNKKLPTECWSTTVHQQVTKAETLYVKV